METPSTTHEERVMAALAHVGIIANGFNLLGIIAAALLWSTQRKQSPYVAEHALQALVFQVISLLVFLVLFLLWLGSLSIFLLPALFRPDLYQFDLPLFFRLALPTGLTILVMFAVGMGSYGLMGALAAWRGRPFAYALVGPFIRRNSQRDQQATDLEPPISLATPVEPVTDEAAAE
jgi:uncharacterized Tic20 family protein